MKKYSFRRKKFLRLPLTIWLAVIALIILFAGGYLGVKATYNRDLKPVSLSGKSDIISITKGSTIAQIAKQLEDAKVIRSAWAFELYVHSHKNYSLLQAGDYDLSPNLSTQDIVAIISQGRVSTNLVTILPGERIDQIKADFINKYGFSPDAVNSALDPSNYSDLPVMAFKPADVTTLEGLLWPDSFEKAPYTDPSFIIRESLTEMGQQLTPTVQSSFANEGLSTYQGLVLTSVIIQEVNKPSDQAQVAQVFLARLKNGMVLGSDVTALYGSLIAGQAPNLSYDSPYNTLINKGLPPTPISTINDTSLYGATHPTNTNYLYFVTGDNGTTYFATTYQQHQAQTAQYCHKLCSN